MKHFARLLLLAICAFASTAHAALPEPIAKALKRAGVPQTSIGIYVREANAAKPLLAHRAEQSMNPASTIKLVTTYAGLEILGPAHQWQTEIYARGEMRGDSLDGDLIIKGYGDPKLTLEHFWLALRSLRQRGLREIRGDLVLDRSFFAVKAGDPGGFDNEPTRPYNVAPDALLINFNAVRLDFIPDAGVVKVLADPHPPGFKIDNRLNLTITPCGDWTEQIDAATERAGADIALVLKGNYSVQCEEKTRHYSVLEHTPYIYGVFRQLWREVGGELRGGVREESALPASARLLYTHHSPNLAEIVRDVNKFSNNVMARQLFLSLGAYEGGSAATPESAVSAVQDWLARKKLLKSGLVLENGSGLSRIERITPANLGDILAAAERSPLMPEFVASLPLAAVDGTMKKRLNGAPVAGRAHIKTGSLDDVRAIAGYVLDAKGRSMIVVSIVNHANAGRSQAVHDALLEWVHQRR